MVRLSRGRREDHVRHPPYIFASVVRVCFQYEKNEKIGITKEMDIPEGYNFSKEKKMGIMTWMYKHIGRKIY